MATPEIVPWIDSAGEDGDRNSMQQFDGDGSQQSFDFNFAGGYIFATDVKAYLYDLASGLTEAVDPVVLTGPNTIFVDPPPTNVNVGRTAGEVLVVYRDTQKTVPLVDYATGAVMSEANLDMSNKQAVFVAAEMVDRFDAINSSSADAIARSFEALTKAEDALDASALAVSDAAAAVSTANTAEATANHALDVAEDAVAASTGFQSDISMFLNAAPTRSILGRTGNVASPGNTFYKIAFVDEGGSGTGGSIRFDRHNKADGAFVDSVYGFDYGGNVNTYGKTLYGVAYPALDDHAANKVYVDDREAAAKTYADTQDGLRLLKTANLSDLANASTARTNLSVYSKAEADAKTRFRTGFLDLIGGALSATTLNMNASVVWLKNASGDMQYVQSGANITLDMTTQGVNGRDQAGNFNGQWVYVHYIWNGTTLGLVASLSRTAPTLPSGYTHWAFAAPVRITGVNNNLVAFILTNNEISYQANLAILYSGGVSTGSAAMTATGVYVPPIRCVVNLAGLMTPVTGAGNAGTFQFTIRPTGGGNTQIDWQVRAVFNGSGVVAYTPVFGRMWREPTSDLVYGIVLTEGTGSATVYVTGYTFSNGAS